MKLVNYLSLNWRPLGFSMGKSVMVLPDKISEGSAVGLKFVSSPFYIILYSLDA
jgi:hypothetical protein